MKADIPIIRNVSYKIVVKFSIRRLCVLLKVLGFCPHKHEHTGWQLCLCKVDVAFWPEVNCSL